MSSLAATVEHYLFSTDTVAIWKLVSCQDIEVSISPTRNGMAHHVHVHNLQPLPPHNLALASIHFLLFRYDIQIYVRCLSLCHSFGFQNKGTKTKIHSRSRCSVYIRVENEYKKIEAYKGR